MAKIIKEILIMLLVCLAGLLLFAVILYEYVPNRKIVPEVAEYKESEKVQAIKADDIEKNNKQVVLTYKITSADLVNYKSTKKYVPGKSNPFAAASADPEAGSTDKKDLKSTNDDSSKNNSGKSSGSGSSDSNSSTSNNGDLK